MWGTCCYALWRGSRSERIASVSILLNVYLSLLVMQPFATRFRHVEVPIMIVDVALFAVLLAVSLRSEKFWPLWLTAMQGLGTLSHLAPLVPHVIPWAYGNAVAMWMYPMLILLAVATHRLHRDRQAHRHSTG